MKNEKSVCFVDKQAKTGVQNSDSSVFKYWLVESYGFNTLIVGSKASSNMPLSEGRFGESEIVAEHRYKTEKRDYTPIVVINYGLTQAHIYF